MLNGRRLLLGNSRVVTSLVLSASLAELLTLPLLCFAVSSFDHGEKDRRKAAEGELILVMRWQTGGPQGFSVLPWFTLLRLVLLQLRH